MVSRIHPTQKMHQKDFWVKFSKYFFDSVFKKFAVTEYQIANKIKVGFSNRSTYNSKCYKCTF
ncbi:hypothetical protein ASE40_08585 [Flavobacterium sp. Root935]|nr:hypothetical protein ASE40_08585 [Flavobacterium sp. Root935]